MRWLEYMDDVQQQCIAMRTRGLKPIMIVVGGDTFADFKAKSEAEGLGVMFTKRDGISLFDVPVREVTGPTDRPFTVLTNGENV